MAFQNSEVMPSPLSQHAGRYLLQTIEADNDATIDITSGIDDTYDRYEIEFISFKLSADGGDLYIRFSDDGGSTYKNTSGDYYHCSMQASSNTSTPAGGAHTGVDGIRVYQSGLGNASNETMNAIVTLSSPSVAGITKKLRYQSDIISTTGHTAIVLGGGHCNVDTNIVNALQIYANTGTIASGTIKLYGIK